MSLPTSLLSLTKLRVTRPWYRCFARPLHVRFVGDPACGNRDDLDMAWMGGHGAALTGIGNRRRGRSGQESLQLLLGVDHLVTWRDIQLPIMQHEQPFKCRHGVRCEDPLIRLIGMHVRGLDRMLDCLVAFNGFVPVASLLQEPHDIRGAYQLVEKIRVPLAVPTGRQRKMM